MVRVEPQFYRRPVTNNATPGALALCLKGNNAALPLFNSFVVVLTTAESSMRLWVGHPAVSHLILFRGEETKRVSEGHSGCQGLPQTTSPEQGGWSGIHIWGLTLQNQPPLRQSTEEFVLQPLRDYKVPCASSCHSERSPYTSQDQR